MRSTTRAILPAAQVLLPSTALGALTDSAGYYFINNVPVGSYTVRAQFIGYAPAEVRGVQILGGQTTDLDIILQESAIAVAAVTVTVAGMGAPRDEVASKTIVPGELIRNLPVDQLRNIVTLQPGVVELGGQDGFSLRGSRPGEVQTYIDGAPVRPVASSFRVRNGVAAGNRTERQAPEVPTIGAEEVTVTTGALAPSQGNAQAGAIAFSTRSGGERASGSFSWETDEPFANTVSQGLNRFEGALGGPVPGIPRLRYFVSGALQGARSSGAEVRIGGGFFRAQGLAAGWDQVPTFISGAPDTTVVWESDTLSHDTRSVVIPTFIQTTGVCGTLGSNATAVSRAMRRNYGFACQGARLPMNWRTDGQLQSKLLYSYGLGSTVSITGLANGTQRRLWPALNILDPALFQGEHRWSRAAILNLSHQMFRRTSQSLAINLNASWQQDQLLAGPLAPEYELSSRSPALGIELGSIRFSGLDAIQYPVTHQLVLAQLGGVGVVVPYEGRDDLRNTQEFRINPMGVATSGWYSRGMEQDAQMHWERRRTAQLVVDWQANRFHRLTFGGEGLWTTVAHWEAGNLTNRNTAGMYRESPVVYALFGSERLDLGDVVLEFGVRWDYFHTHSRFPNRFVHETPADTTIDAIAAWYMRTTIPGVGHAALSPRVRVSFPVAEHTDLRLSFGRQVQVPEFFFTFGNNDVTFGQTVMYEFGMRQAVSPRAVLDVALYNKDIRSELSLRRTRYPDPSNPGAFTFPPVVLNLDFGYARGGEIRLDLRPGSGLQATLSYAYQTSRSTGSDPLAVFYGTISQIVNIDSILPAQSVTVTDFDRTHTGLATVTWSVPRGSALARLGGGVLRDVAVFATARYQSGLPYTSQDRSGRRLPVHNDARQPSVANVDARVTKTFTLGRLAAVAYLDVRNVLNFRSVNAINPVTRTIDDSIAREGSIANELFVLHGEAEGNGQANPSQIDVSDCRTWRQDPVDCVALERAEARYGNGDGSFTLDEQRRAFLAAYNLLNGPQWFYRPPRRMRIGVELSF